LELGLDFGFPELSALSAPCGNCSILFILFKTPRFSRENEPADEGQDGVQSQSASKGGSEGGIFNGKW